MVHKGRAYAAFGVAAFMFLGIGLNVGKGYSVVAFALALLFCVALPATLGVVWLRPGDSGERLERADRMWTAELLRLAERRAGSLTVVEVMAHAGLSSADAERHLDRLCAQGLAEHRISDDGTIVYRFIPSLSAQQKREAVGVLDD